MGRTLVRLEGTGGRSEEDGEELERARVAEAEDGQAGKPVPGRKHRISSTFWVEQILQVESGGGGSGQPSSSMQGREVLERARERRDADPRHRLCGYGGPAVAQKKRKKKSRTAKTEMDRRRNWCEERDEG